MLAKYFFVAAAVVGGVMAAKCDSQPQFDLCKQNMQGYIDACEPNEPQCLCRTNRDLLEHCYPLCPQDLGKGSQESTVSSWCVSAGGDKSSSVLVVTATTTASTGATGTTYPTTTPTSTDTSSGNKTETTSTTSKPQESGNAGNMLAPAGFMVAAAAIAGLVL